MATGRGTLERFADGRARWIVVVASFCILFVVRGNVATYGVFISPIESDFGWSRTTISITFAIFLLATAVASPITGRLIDQYGPSRTLPIFIAFVAIPLIALSAMTSLGHLFVLYAIIGFAITGIGINHISSIITKWFDTRTLLTSGIAISGFSLGQLVFNPVAAELILTYDWRLAYLVFGALTLVTIPLAYFFVKSPDPGAPEPDRDADLVINPIETVESVATALRTRSLWLLIFTFFICGFTTVGLVTTHFVPYLLSRGFSDTVAAQGAGALGGMTVFGLLGMGVIGDRYASRKRIILASIYFLRGITLLFLLMVTSVLDIFLFAAVYGFLTLCTVPLHAGITADRFGTENLTTLVGLQYTGHQVGGAIAALGAGWVFDTLGTYQWAHLVGVALLMVAPVLVLADRHAAGSAS